MKSNPFLNRFLRFFSINFFCAARVDMLISLGAGCEVRGAGGVSPLHVATSVQLVSAAQQAFKHQSNMILLFTAVFAFESVRLQCQVCIPS